MKFELIGRIENVEIIANGGRIDDLPKLRKRYGRGRWRKLKGIGRVRLPDGSECLMLSCIGMRQTELGQERNESQRTP